MRNDLAVRWMIASFDTDDTARELWVMRSDVLREFDSSRAGSQDEPFHCRLQRQGDVVIIALVRRVALAVDCACFVVRLLVRQRRCQLVEFDPSRSKKKTFA